MDTLKNTYKCMTHKENTNFPASETKIEAESIETAKRVLKNLGYKIKGKIMLEKTYNERFRAKN